MESPQKTGSRKTGMFVPPPALQKLRGQNEQLRLELRNLSSQLDSLLNTYPKKPSNPSLVRSKEISSAKTQLDHYEKQLRDLQRQQSQFSPTKLPDLQEQVTALQEQIKGKEVANKSLRRLEKDRGTTLSSLSEDAGSFQELKTVTEDVRRKMRTVAEMEGEIGRGEEAHKQVKEKILSLEEKYKGIVAQGGGVDDTDEPKPMPVVSQDLSDIKAKVAQLEKKKASDCSAYRRETQSTEAQLALLQKQVQETQLLVKEKEQKRRILTLQFSEIGRNLKMLAKKNGGLVTSLKIDSGASISPDVSSTFITHPMSEEKASKDEVQTPGDT